MPAFINLICETICVREGDLNPLYKSYSIFLGAAMNRITYSNVNHPTNTASAISKKYSSSAIFCWKLELNLAEVEILTNESIFIFLLKSWKSGKYKAQC